MELCGECHNLVFRQRDGVVIHVILKSQGDADWARRGNVTFGGRQAESEVRGKSEKGTKVVISEAFWGEPEYIVDIPECAILATVTMCRAITASEFIK